MKTHHILGRLVCTAFLLALPLHAEEEGVKTPLKKIVIIKPTLVDSTSAKVSGNPSRTVPGVSSPFEVTVGSVPSAHLTNGKLKMRFQAFVAEVGKDSTTVWKLVQASAPMAASNFASGQFTGNNEIDLTPDGVTSVQFQLDADTYEGEDDFLMLIVARVAFPATGAETDVYQTATIYFVDCP